MSSPEDMGTGWRGAFGSFMIISSTLLKSDWSKFSIWNGVMGSQPIRMKHRTGPGKVWERSLNSPGEKSQVQEMYATSSLQRYFIIL